MPIYVGNQKINVDGIEKVYVGTTLVYQMGIVALDYISLSGQTTSLPKGSAFSFGGTVTAHYTDGTTADVTADTTFSGYNMSVVGNYTVTASYTENGITKTATYTLQVTASWTTLWSGSKTISWTLGSSWRSNKPSNVTVWDADSTLPDTATIRVTFTMSNRVGKGHYNDYTTNAWTLTTKPSSPYQVSNLNTTSTASKVIVGVEGTRSDSATNAQARLIFQWYKISSTRRFRLISQEGELTGSAASGTISITVTKIELLDE